MAWCPAAQRAGLRAPPAAIGGEGCITLRARGALTWLSRTCRTPRLCADQLQPGHLRTGRSRDMVVAGCYLGSRWGLRGEAGRGVGKEAPGPAHAPPARWTRLRAGLLLGQAVQAAEAVSQRD